jgi:hypothetical protein
MHLNRLSRHQSVRLGYDAPHAFLKLVFKYNLPVNLNKLGVDTRSTCLQAKQQIMVA